MLENISAYLGYVAPVLLLLFVVFGALGGLIKCFFRGLLNLAKVVAAAILALPVTAILTNLLSTKGVEKLLPLLEKAGLDVSQAPSLEEAVIDLLRAVVAVALYCSSFLVLLVVLGIVALILRPIFTGLEKATLKKKGLSRLLGTVTGAVGGLIVCVTLFMPVFGIAHTVYAATGTLLTSENSQIVTEESRPMIEDVNMVADKLCNNAAEDIVWRAGQESLYRTVTTVKTEYGKAVLDDEIQSAVAITNDIMGLAATPVDQYGQKEIDSINHIVKELQDRVLLPEILAGFLHDASTAWMKGDTFFGVAAPGTDSEYGAILNSVYVMFSKTDAKTIGKDLGVFADMVGTLHEYDVLSKLNSTEDLMAALTQEGLLTELLDKLSENENTAVLLDGLVDTAMDMVAKELGIPEDDAAVMDEILNSSADSWNEVLAIEDVTERTEVLSEKLKDVFDDYEVEISDGMVDTVAAIMVENFSDLGEIDTDNLSGFLLAVASSYATYLVPEENPSGVAHTAPVEGTIVFLADVTVDDSMALINSFFTAVKDVIQQGGSDEDLAAALKSNGFSDTTVAAAATLMAEVKSGTATMDVTLGNRETFKANCVTAASLKSTIGSELLTKNENNISNLESVLSVASQIISSGSADTAAIMNSVASVASGISGETIREMVKLAISQDNLGINNDVRSSIKVSLNSLTNTDLEVLATKLDVISHLNDYVNALSKNENSDAIMSTILEVLDVPTAKVLAKMVNPGLIMSFGVKKEQAADYASLVSAIINHYDESDGNVAAMQLVIRIGLNQRAGVPMFGEDSVTGLEAADMVSKFMNSSMVLAALRSSGADALGLSTMMSNADKAAVDSALNSGDYAAADIAAIRNLLGID